MKKIVFTLVIIVLLFTMGCSKTTEEVLTEKTWVIVGIKQHADSNWNSLLSEFITLSFLEDRYILQSSSDCIIAKVKIGMGNIDFEDDMSRTIMSESTKICLYVLHKCKYYKMEGHENYQIFTLTGDNGERIDLRAKGWTNDFQ
jgi:hypothetical protein